MSKNKHKGDKAEKAFEKVAVFKGWTIAEPFSEETRYDYLVDKGDGGIDRVQVKHARPDAGGDTMVFNTASVGRDNNGNTYRNSYSKNEIDVIASYYEPLDKCYYIPIEDLKEGQKEMRLRFADTKNNQEKRVNWADFYELKTPECGQDVGEQVENIVEYFQEELPREQDRDKSSYMRGYSDALELAIQEVEAIKI